MSLRAKLFANLRFTKNVASRWEWWSRRTGPGCLLHCKKIIKLHQFLTNGVKNTNLQYFV